MYRRMEGLIPFRNQDSFFDVCIISARKRLDSHFFEMLHPHPERIPALSDLDAYRMEKAYSGSPFQFGGGGVLPCADDLFGLIFLFAVAEHTGSAENQANFIRKLSRIHRKYFSLATPNRYHPLEFHTALPRLYRLPQRLHRKIFPLIGRKDFSEKPVLYPVAESDLRSVVKKLVNNCRFKAFHFFGFRSHLLFFLRKRGCAS